MDDLPIPNSHYALQLALQTMKDRCIQLQKRVTFLEEENISLKLKNVKEFENISQNSLELKVSMLTEEKNQLKNTISMITTENKQLWSNLSRLTNENKTIGSKISKITDSLSQHGKNHTPLIRSRTFTQEVPHTKHLQKVLSENDKVSLELEDISLKLQSSFSKEKNELEMQVYEMSNLKDDLNSLGFNYLDEDVDESIAESIEQHLLDFRNIKIMLQQHNDILKASVDSLDKAKTNIEHNKLEKKKIERCATKTVQVNIDEEGREAKKLSEQQDWDSPATSLELDRNIDKICPMCSKKFHYDINFEVFSLHVEEHFLDNDLLRL